MKDISQLETDALEYVLSNTAVRIGERIRTIRNIKGLSQTELGQKAGMTSDRIYKYETGARKPDPDAINRIANALEVSPFALVDPVSSHIISAIFAMFELENTYEMKIDIIDDEPFPRFCLSADYKSSIYSYLREWYFEYVRTQTALDSARTIDEKESVMKSYDEWKLNFPQGIIDKHEKEQLKEQLRRRIDELQKAYDQLDQDD